MTMSTTYSVFDDTCGERLSTRNVLIGDLTRNFGFSVSGYVGENLFGDSEIDAG